MGLSNKLIALITFCCLLYNGLADEESLAKHKGTVKTIKSENGEVIDCVDIHKQPAFDHPLLRNHTIQVLPKSRKNNKNVNFQAWHKNGQYCPKGSVPIVRRQSNYPNKVSFNPSEVSINRMIDAPGHEYALGFLLGHDFYGTNATFNVWNPQVELDQEFSLSQVWVVGGSGPDRNTIEAGWIVRNGQPGPTIFIYWTRDNYMSTGCYNFDCPGFVQVSRKAAVGVAIHPLSTYNGRQFDITIAIAKDLRTGNWWLKVHNIKIGYWPNNIFTALRGSATQLHWGGEIINLGTQGRHTTTQMGSGHFPGEGFRRASFVRNIKFKDQNGFYRDPENLQHHASKPHCYDVNAPKKGPLTGVHFYYGGPGFSDKCRV